MTTKVECPNCKRKDLVLGDGAPRCRCSYTDRAEKVAERYVENILGISRHARTMDGGELPIYECPSCDMGATMVDLGSSDGEALSLRFICFDCGSQWKDRDLVECDGAGSRSPHWARPFDAAVCDDCIADVSSRDD